MLGKKSGLGGRLRKLLGRIQKEFYFPKVYNVRCTVAAHPKTWRDDVQVPVHMIQAPRARVRSLSVELSPTIHTGRVQEPGVCLSERMEALETQVRQKDCYHAAALKVNRVEIIKPGAHVRRIDPRKAGRLTTRIRSMDLQAEPPALNTSGLFQDPATAGSRMDMARFPYRLRVQPMKSLPMRVQIRYRAQVLTVLNLKPNQVNFVGVVLGLPSAPLKLLELENSTSYDRPIALAAQTGRFNSFMGARVWVIIQLNGKPDYLTVVLKEEE